MDSEERLSSSYSGSRNSFSRLLRQLKSQSSLFYSLQLLLSFGLAFLFLYSFLVFFFFNEYFMQWSFLAFGALHNIMD